MNENKFCFISCVNNQDYYRESKAYVDNLYVPEGYEVEIISLEDSKSMTSGYNEAMKSSDAKYKIYLHQDTFIVNKNFLLDVLLIFKKNINIGMIGMVGCEKLPLNAIWWESKSTIGEVIESSTGECKILKFRDVEGKYQEVQGIDGFLMITQYDIPWREDIFKGWHFYDISQTMEFKRNGYKTVVPRQTNTWCVHDCGIVKTSNGYEEYRNLFLEEYYRDSLPLVSILIPTYNNIKCLEESLQSALKQTYKNVEIIIGDNSRNDEIYEFVKKIMKDYKNIEYCKIRNKLEKLEVETKLLKLAKGKYINFILNGDLLDSTKIEKMMNFFINDINKEIGLVASNSKIIDEKGVFIKNFIEDEMLKIVGDKIWNGKELFNLILEQGKNIIGELTTVLFDRNKMTEEFGYFNGVKCISSEEQGVWFNLLGNKKAIILKESLNTLSENNYKSQIEEKNTNNWAQDYTYFILNAQDKGFFNNIEYINAIKICNDYIKNKKEKSNYIIRNQRELQNKLQEIIQVTIKEIEIDDVKTLINQYYNSKEIINICIETSLHLEKNQIFIELLEFYKKTWGQNVEYYIFMHKYLKSNDKANAELCLRIAFKMDKFNYYVNMELAKMYKEENKEKSVCKHLNLALKNATIEEKEKINYQLKEYNSKNIKAKIGLIRSYYSYSNTIPLYNQIPDYIKENYEVVLVEEGEVVNNEGVCDEFIAILDDKFGGCICQNTLNIDLWHGFTVKGVGIMDPKISNFINVNHFNNYVDIRFSYSTIGSTLINACHPINVNKYIVSGMPRNDYFRECIGEKEKRVIIYMPTFRERPGEELQSNNSFNNSLFGYEDENFRQIIEFLEGNNIELIMKPHPVEQKKYESIITNLKSPNVKVITEETLSVENKHFYEILANADLLITDYSSVSYDFLLMDKPILYNLTDLDKYIHDRGFLLDPVEEWMPGEKVYEFRELIKRLEEFNQGIDYFKNERAKIRNIVHKYNDFNSSERVWNNIYNYINLK